MKLFGTRSGLFSAGNSSKWTQLSGPHATIKNADSLITSVVGFTAGTYYFKLNNKCQDGIISEDTVCIVVLPLTIANAGPDTTICPTNTYRLKANGNLLPTEKGEWTVISNAAGIIINSPTDPSSTISLLPGYPGVIKLRWTITNINGCTSFDDVAIENCGGVAPVNAGPDQILENCYSTVTCTKLVATNGGIGLGGQIGTWIFVSGPTIPAINSPNSAVTQVCNLSEGTYVFRYTVVGPCASGSDEVKVTVPLSTQSAPEANGNVLGLNTAICGDITSMTLTGNNPRFAGEVVQWTQVSGPVNVHINTPNNPSTIVTGFSKPGFYTFNYTITNTNTGCSGNSLVRCVRYEAGTVNGGPDQVLPCNVTEVTIPTDTTGYGFLIYRIVNGPAGCFNYPTLFQNPNKFKGLNLPGTYRIEVNFQFGAECEAVSDFVDVTVSRTPTGSNAGTYQTFTCTSTSTQLAGNNPALTGLGCGIWSQVSGPNPAVLVNPTNYICDVKQTVPGAYVFRWTINGGNSCPDNHDDIVVITPGTTVTKANAGSDKVICYNSPVSLEGNIFRADETAHWTVNSNDITFSPSSQVANPIVSGLKANSCYTFVYSIANSCGNYSIDSVKITTGSNEGPSVALAGADQCLAAGTASIQLHAVTPLTGEGKWTQIEGPISQIVDAAQNNTTVTDVTNGNYKFSWTVSTNGCSNETKDTVSITISGNTTIAHAGMDITACAASQVLNANTPEFGSGYWSQISGNGNAIITDPSLATTEITNLSTGLYTFRWTISNGVCSSNYDDVILNITTPPSTANAGPDISICNADFNSIELHAKTPSSGSGQWVWITGPSLNPHITNSTSPNAIISGVNSGSHTFRWMVSNGAGCPSSIDDLIVNISMPANVGNDKSLCNLTSTFLKGNIGSKGTWSQLSGPSATILQTPIDNPIGNITGLVAGASYTFRYTIPAIAGCPSTYDDIIVNNGALTLIPNAGADEIYCNATSFALNGSKPGPGEKGTWSIISGQTGGTFLPNANTPNATLTGVTNGIYILQWTISNGSCSNSDVKRIDNYATPTTANAGSDDTLCLVNNITLNANTPANGIGKWSQISGPNQIIFDTPNNPKSQVIGLTAGTYHFAWTISSSNSCSASTDEVAIVILKNADLAYAGADQDICGKTTALNGNTPTGTNKGIWQQLSGPNNATISSVTNPTATLTNLIPGTYKFIWKIYNEKCFNSDIVEIIVKPSVTVNAGNDFNLCNKVYSIPLSGASITGYTSTGSWSIIAGEGTLSSTSPTNNPSSVIFYPNADYTGSIVLRLSANDNCHTVYDDITITIDELLPFIKANDDSVRTDPNTSVTIDVLKNDNSFGIDKLKLCSNAITLNPVHGTVMINGDGTISYKPANGFLGIDSFNYKVCNVVSTTQTSGNTCYKEGKDNAWVYVTVEGCIIPNAFSPDGDGVNDFFEIPCAQGDVKFNVFNRWGIEVYKNDAYANNWDGSYNGAPLPEGTYFYILKYSSDNINQLNKDGFITIRR